MSLEVRKVTRARALRPILLLSVSALAACSSDAMRMSDSFYSGAAPLPAMQSAPAGTSYGVDSTATGSINAGGAVGALPSSPASGGYGAASQVTRSQLPPPPGTAAYQPAPSAPAPVNTASLGVPSAAPQPRPVNVASAPAAAAAAPTLAPPTAAPAAQRPQVVAAGGQSVTVQPGDSLNAIAKRTGVSVADLRAANGLATDNIRIGQALQLPAGSQHQRVAALGAAPTTLQAQAAVTPAAPQPVAAAPAPAAPAPAAQPAAAAAPAAATTVAEETNTAALAPASTGIDQFRWPVQGRVVKGFGDRVGSRRNDGVNISVPRGTPIKAAENGVVIYAGEGLKEFGKTVLVKHDNGLVTVYGHADDILVERGATVRRGDDIAKAGMTGETDSPMLHFEVRKDSTPVDPMTYLR